MLYSDEQLLVSSKHVYIKTASVIFCSKDGVLMVRNLCASDKSVHKRYMMFETPGGGLKTYEGRIAGALREFREECGFHVVDFCVGMVIIDTRVNHMIVVASGVLGTDVLVRKKECSPGVFFPYSAFEAGATIRQSVMIDVPVPKPPKKGKKSKSVYFDFEIQDMTGSGEGMIRQDDKSGLSTPLKSTIDNILDIAVNLRAKSSYDINTRSFRDVLVSRYAFSCIRQLTENKIARINSSLSYIGLDYRVVSYVEGFDNLDSYTTSDFYRDVPIISALVNNDYYALSNNCDLFASSIDAASSEVRII